MTIIGASDGGLQPATAADATRTGRPLNQTPASVSVIGPTQLEQQRPRSLSQALDYSAGVNAGLAGRRGFDEFNLRGFNQSAALYRDGLRLDPGFLIQQDLAGIERIEIVRGPASIYAGQIAPGGFINVVSRLPTDGPLAAGALQVGTDGLIEPSFDLGSALDDAGRWHYRLAAAAFERDDAIDFVTSERRMAAPSLRWRPRADTQLTLAAVFQHDRFVRAVGLPARGTVVPNPVGSIAPSRFLGEPGVEPLRLPQSQLGYRFEQQLNSGWTLLHGLRRTDYALQGLNFAAAPLAADNRTVTRSGVELDVENNVLNSDLQLRGAWGGAVAEHRVVVGVDVLRFRNRQTQRAFTAAPLDVFAPVYGGPISFGALNSNRRQLQRQDGVFVQLSSIVASRWVLSAGARYDRFHESTDNYLNSTRAERGDHSTSAQAGVVYLAPGGFAPYASYAESFLPVAGNPKADGSPLDPERGTQWEAGVKWTAADGAIAATLAWFDLARSNVVSADPANTAFSVQVGEQRHRGVEAEAIGRLARDVEVTLALTSLDARITRSTTGDQGQRPRNVPRQWASVWLAWRAAAWSLPDWTLAAGVRHVGDRVGTVATTVIPAYTLIDAAVRWRLPRPGWSATLNVRNLTDRVHYLGGLNSNQVSVGEPRSVVVAVRYVGG